MELIKIPLLPQWHVTSNNCLSTPDGGFLYIGLRSISYISAIENKTQAPIIRTFNTRLTIFGIDVDPYWPKNSPTTSTASVNNTIGTGVDADKYGAWGDIDDEETGACAINLNNSGNEKICKSLPKRMFAVANQDYSIQVWDFDKGYVIQAHKAHCIDDKIQTDGNNPHLNKCAARLLLSYISNRNVLSMDQKNLVIYCVASNTYYCRPTFISKRYIISSLKCSPYNERQFAIGCNDGLILLCDLQRMSVLYTLRGHNSPVVSLTWNRIVKKKEKRQQQQQSEQKPMQQPTSDILKAAVMIEEAKLNQSQATSIDADTENIFDIYDYNYLDNEFGASNDQCLMMNTNMTKSSQSNFICKEREGSSLATDNFNFMEACQNLKDDIKAAQQHQLEYEKQSGYNSDEADNSNEVQGTNDNENMVVTLDECKQAAALLLQENAQTFSAAPTISSTSNTIMSNDEQKQESVKENQQDNDDTIGSNDNKELNPSNKISTSDEGSLYGCMLDRNIKFVLHQAEVHTMQTKYENQQQPEKTEARTDDHHYQRQEQHHGLHDGNNKNATEAIDADILLASISLDCCVGLWNANTGSSCCYRKIRGPQAAQNTYIQWLDSNYLITSNRQGFIKFWYVRYIAEKTNENSNYVLEIVQRKILSKSPVVTFAACQTKQILWYMTINKNIVMEDLKRKEILMNLGCVSTNIGVIKECPDNMNKIALGFSDRRIGIIDLSKMTPNNIPIENFIRSIESPVLSLVWSPDSQRIAYGTNDSRIGILYVEARSKPPVLLRPISGKPIYSMCWQEIFLYVVCNERVTIYNEKNDFKDSFIIPDILGASSMSVYKNYLFVGTQTGQLYLYKWNLSVVAAKTFHSFHCELIQRLELTTRYISDIQWCPLANEPTMAIVSNSNSIYIYNFNPIDGALSMRKKITITSAKAANATVKWSYSNVNRFMTCGLDGAIRIWDLSKNYYTNNNTNNPMELYFIKYFPCPMMSGLFMPMNDEVILCVGKSTCLEMFDMRTKSDSNGNKGVVYAFSSGTLDKVQWATTALTRNDIKTTAALKKAIMKKQKVATPAEQKDDTNVDNDNGRYNTENDDIVANKENISECQLEQASKMLQKFNLESMLPTTPYLQKPSTLLSLTSKELYKNSLEVMCTILNNVSKEDNKTPTKLDTLVKQIGNGNNEESLCVKLFGTRAQVRELLNIELENQQKGEGKHVANMFIPQLTANLKEEIIETVKNKQLTEWHVSQAPTVSYGFWKECCKAFSNQLLEQGYALQAATYMLAIYNSTEAIDILLKENYYKEALIVARIHLQPDHPLCFKISEKWINHLYEHGNLMEASLICLLTNQKERSYTCLTKIRKATQEIEVVRNLLKNYSNNK